MQITSELALLDWGVVFKEPLSATTAMGQFVHRGIILGLNMPSMLGLNWDDVEGTHSLGHLGGILRQSRTQEAAEESACAHW